MTKHYLFFPPGISAALGAARASHSSAPIDVLIVERFGCFGGVITTVGMETLGWYRYEGCSVDSEGIGQELERVSKRMGAGDRKWAFNDSECLDTENFKIIADDLLESCGARTLLHTTFVDAGKRKARASEARCARDGAGLFNSANATVTRATR